MATSGSTTPILNTSASPNLAGVASPSGITAATLVHGAITYPAGVVEAVAIEAVDTSLGTWQYSLDGGSTWLTVRADLIDSSTNTLSLLLGPADMIRLLPFGDLQGTVANALTFRAWDESSGSRGSYLVTTPGVGAFSAASDTASVTVTPPNHAPTFAPAVGTGSVIVPVSGDHDFAHDALVQPDGKIVLAGGSNGNGGYGIVRLNADGHLDTSFGSGGTVTVSIGAFGDSGQSLTLQPDGKILVAGFSDELRLGGGDDFSFSLVRLNADGSLDTSFGNGGTLLVNDSGNIEFGYSVSLLADGRIMVGGYQSGGATGMDDFSLARLNADGSLDTSFGTGGWKVFQVGISSSRGQAVTVQPDGKVLEAGNSYNGGFGFAVARLDASGNLDASFGSGGVAQVLVQGQFDTAQSLTLQPDGKILVAGNSFNGSDFDIGLVRLNANGTLDTSFGSAGTEFLSLVDGFNDSAYSITLQADGKILVAGSSSNGRNDDFSVVRLDANGALDTTFGSGGHVLLDIGGDNDTAQRVTVQPDGKIVVAGFSYHSGSYDYSVVRLNADGSRDTTFNGVAVDTLGGTIGYTENAAPVPLDTQVAVYDANLAALNGGVGNYAGASVLLARQGGAQAQDQFSAAPGPLVFDSGDAVLSGVHVGSVKQSGGALTITFNSNATQAVVNAVLSNLAYANASDAPPPSVTIDWTFRDGNTGAQGAGGALTGTGSTHVNITSLNDPATGGLTILGTPTQGMTLTLDNTVSDPDGMSGVVIQWLADGSPIADAHATSLVLDATLVHRQISAEIDYIDGFQGTPRTVTSSPTAPVVGLNLPPVLNASANPILPTVAEGATADGPMAAVGTTVSALVDGSISDADAGGPVNAIAIEAVNTSLGTWQYSLDGGTTWLALRADLLGSTTNNLALLLGPTDMIRLVPFGDLHGTLADALTFCAWDMSSGNRGDYAVATPGTGAFSADSDTAAITVIAVDEAPTFAPAVGTGAVIVAPSGYGVGFQNSTVQSDGKILGAGTVLNGYNGYYDFTLIRLNADGSLDTSFDGDGKVMLSSGSGGISDYSYDYGQTVIVQPDGKILEAGSSATYNVSSASYQYTITLMRLKTDGSLDTSFGVGGKVLIPSDHNANAQNAGCSVALQPDGRILVSGGNVNSPATTNYDFSLVRLNADGSLDTSFGTGGKVLTDVLGNSDYGSTVAVLPDGRILETGYSFDPAVHRYEFTVVRLNANGSLDTSFGVNGKAVAPTASGFEVGNSLAVQPDGMILQGGYALDGATSNYDFKLARFTATGSLDTGFGVGGEVLTPVGPSYNFGWSVTLQADGKILEAGYSYNPAGTGYDFGIIRLNPDGSPDTGFGNAGKVLIPVGMGSLTDMARSINVLPDGKIVVGGDTAGNFSVVRLNADGSLDTTFGGVATDTLGGTISYTENAAPVALDASVAVRDAELAALNGGLGDYGGASVTLARHGGAQAQDQFSAAPGPLVFDSGDAVLSGVHVGSVHPSGGALTITFYGGATQAQVNAVLSNLAYANSSDAPPASVQVDWTFSDGNTGTQGSGGAQQATGSTTVNITPVNDDPTGGVAILGAAQQGVTLSLSNTLVDPDGMTQVGVQWLADNNPIGGATGTSLTLGQSLVGKLISVTVSYIDGYLDTPRSFTSAQTSAVLNVNDAPTGSVTITGTPMQYQTLTAQNTLADLDGLGTIGYQWFANGVAINGATSNQWALGQGQVGQAISVVASYVDGYGAHESVASSATGAVANVNDAPTGGVTITGTPTQGQTLTAHNSLADLDGLGAIGYQWFANGVAISGATTDHLLLGTAQVGKTVTVVASYVDGYGAHESVSSGATATVGGVFTAGTSGTVTGTAGNDTLIGGTSKVTLAGGLGDDTYVVTNPNTTVSENANAGTDTVQSSVAFTLPANVENLTLTGSDPLKATGNSLANVIIGNSGDNQLIGGGGADTLTGGAGADRFVFNTTQDSSPSAMDTITDFNAAAGDRIDLSLIDANPLKSGDQAFTFIGTSNFTGAAGELRYDTASGNLYGNTNGDAQIELAIHVGVPIHVADVIL